MNTWSLDALYKGYEDKCFHDDIEALKKSVAYGNTLTQQLDKKDEKDTCIKIVKHREEQLLLALKLREYCTLRQSVDTTDPQTVSYLNQIDKICADASRAHAQFDQFIAQMEALDQCVLDDVYLREYSFILHEIKENGKYRLSDDVEEALAKMDMSGGSAWDSLQSYLTSTLSVNYRGEKTTLSQIRNLAHNQDVKVRKEAYEAELASYEKIKDSIAFAINNIKAQVNTECELRGYASPLAKTLQQSRMNQSTLDAMMEAMNDFLPVFHKYLKHKATLLGYKNGLPWYELFAPIGADNHTYSIAESKEYLISHFAPFAKDMADMIERSFDEEWIDFYPKNGKVGGAFCANLPFIKQSRVLTNFGGSLGDIVTLAHELGHAYHGMMIEDHRILNTDYSMPVAETASTFNENIIMNAAIDDASGSAKVALIESQLQDLTQIICDIYSRYLFENEVFNRRSKGFMFADELNEIMLKAQRTAYGDGLDPNYLHPYMWICKSHYYSSHLSFYNFPYAFGGLFARGLIVKYQQEGDGFVETYRNLLKATTISSVEDCAMIADIDLSDKAFWISALKTCENRIQEFIDLTKS